MGSVISINSHVSEIDPLLLRPVPKYNLKRPLKAQANYVHASDRMFYMVTHKYLYFFLYFFDRFNIFKLLCNLRYSHSCLQTIFDCFDAVSIFLEIQQCLQRRIKWFKKGTIFFISYHSTIICHCFDSKG